MLVAVTDSAPFFPPPDVGGRRKFFFLRWGKDVSMKSRFPFLFECKWLATYAVDRSSHKDTRRNDKELLLETSPLLCECFFLFSFFLVLIIHSGNGVVVDVRAYIQNGRSISPVNLRFPFIIHMWWCTVARPIYCQPACCFGPTCEHNDLVALHGLSLSPPSERKKATAVRPL